MSLQDIDCQGDDSPKSTQMPMSGDFYAAPEVYRSVECTSIDDILLEANVAAQCKQDSHETAQSKRSVPEYNSDTKEQIQVDNSDHFEHFQPTDKPPLAPNDDRFQVEVTTLYLRDEEPWISGNRLLEILSEEATAQIQKVNRRKFTVKASVLWEGLTCEVKVRAYVMHGNGYDYVLEFQRVDGDTIAFNGMFQLVQSRLSPRSGKAQLSMEQPPPLAPLDRDDTADMKGALLPLIDAAQHAADVSVQAEAAAGLADAAKDPTLVDQLCSPQACAAIRQLLKVNCFQVSCQVARLLSNLALLPQAEGCFIGEGILRILFERVWELATGKLLRGELTRAIRCLVTRCATKLPMQVVALMAPSKWTEAGSKRSALKDLGPPEDLKRVAQLLPAAPQRGSANTMYSN
eukprot:TRINITY_DN8375_c0_g1_i1.p1 TRINITY_DN8375_c0_g1~~TRINITY_DN8375_c0_g1_i1.p1  ORF type:complete len:429 (+),score=72.46 TRINITY_DN8375_c0_g1_i1:78-1289(+)